MTSIARLFVHDILEKNKQISIKDKQYNYLINVMQRKVGDKLALVNGINGEFLGEVIDIKKKTCLVKITEKIKEFKNSKGLCLAFGLIKRIEFIAEKGTELGVTEFFPLITRRTVVQKFNPKRFQANVVEAVEQSERLDLPTVHDVLKLKKFIENLSSNDYLIFCEERSENTKKAYDTLTYLRNKISKESKVYVLVGPEGGFSPEEIILIKNFCNTYPINLGELILRTETATIVILGIIQDFFYH